MAATQTAQEALRILRRIDVKFSDNSRGLGSGFVGETKGTVVTCAHVVETSGKSLKEVLVQGSPARVLRVRRDLDLAILEANEQETSRLATDGLPVPGEELLLAGFPTGVKGPSLFPAMLSAASVTVAHVTASTVLQISGMINSGNSGGPIFRDGSDEVVGVITAKHVPLLDEIDKLLAALKAIPQAPTSVILGDVDFSKFVYGVVQALVSVGSCLRLVQVGIGYAIPAAAVRSVT